MNTSVRRFPMRGVAAAILAIVSLMLIGYGLKPVIWQGHRSSGIASAPAPSITYDLTYQQGERELRSSGGYTFVPAPVIADPSGLPEKVELYDGKKRLLAMNIDKQGTVNGDPFASDCGETTWYAARKWPTPGSLSPRKSLITGHGWCRDKIYELDNLRYASKDAVLRVTFDSGDVVIASAIMPAEEIAKTKLNTINENKYNDGDARMIRLSTCDSTSDKRPDGHAEGNVYQIYEVTEVIKK